MTGRLMQSPVFHLESEIHISAPPLEVYTTISDLPRSGEWSEECTGGSWISGDPGEVGAVFRGINVRSENVVAWAPVVRGEWHTYSEVVEAEAGRSFGWAIRDGAGAKQDSVWSFEIEPRGDGCILHHRFRMGEPTEGIRKITADMDDEALTKFVDEWTTKLRADLAATLRRLKAVVETTEQ